jgi:hypothetical protein
MAVDGGGAAAAASSTPKTHNSGDSRFGIGFTFLIGRSFLRDSS